MGHCYYVQKYMLIVMKVKNLPDNILREIGKKINKESMVRFRFTNNFFRRFFPRPYAYTHFFDTTGTKIKKDKFIRNIVSHNESEKVNVEKIEQSIKTEKLIQYGDIVIHPALKPNVNSNENVKTAWKEDIKYKIGIVDEKKNIAYAKFSMWEGFIIPKKFHELGVDYFTESPLADINSYGFVKPRQNKNNINVVNGNSKEITQPTRFGKKFVANTIKNKKLNVNGKKLKIEHGKKVTLPYEILTLRL